MTSPGSAEIAALRAEVTDLADRLKHLLHHWAPGDYSTTVTQAKVDLNWTVRELVRADTMLERAQRVAQRLERQDTTR